MGLTMVKFNDDATRDHVLENGILQFDRKPVIIQPWTADLSPVRLIHSVPLWIRLHDIGLQYWGSKCLSALGVDYEWLPIKCKVCSGYGHSMVDCRKEMKTQWVKKGAQPKDELEEERDKGNQPMVDVPDLKKGSANVATDAEGQNNSEARWKTPKKVATLSKQGPVEAISSLSDWTRTEPKKCILGASRAGGRILVIWRKTFVRVTIIEETNQYVHCVVKMAGQRHAFSATFVYGLNTMEGRKRLWKRLPRLPLPAITWIILGDFNAIFTVKDRNGGKPVSKLELTDPSQWLAGNQVESLKSTGSYFTWTNNQDGPARIYSKIDYVFTNEDWLDSFPNSTAFFRWEVVSDHCSCVISTTTMENMGIKLFRFYNFWTEHQDFKEVVLNSWRKPINGTGLRTIYLKIMRLKHILKRFNRDNIGDIGMKYQKAKDFYQDAQL
ncbi:uncharacterized protein LOC133832461 [Humulus lupulus]|uniref:uncharacterized protein LOC133832461 n=1 Tax=Humulus lupulus TaxID=3486 RepID=UPI002B4144BE|nr:uncharacterized protein LOC133832461 [Humulus lupulus]